MNFKAILTGIVVMCSTFMFAQVTKGKVSYDVFISTDDPAMSAYADKLENSLLEIYFMDGKLRSEFIMGEIMTTTSVSIKGEDTTLVFFDGMMGKIAMKVTEDDMSDERRLAKEKMEVELIDGETKEVLGYKCKKAIITSADSEESIVWYTEEIVPSYREGDYLQKEIPGLPLEMYFKQGNREMKIIAFDFKAKFKKENEVFSLKAPEGYVLKTAEEMKKFGR